MGGYADRTRPASTADAEPAPQSSRPASMKMSSGDYVELASALLLNATDEVEHASAGMKPGLLEVLTRSTLSRCNIAYIELEGLRYRGDKSALIPVVTDAVRRLEVLKTLVRTSAAPEVFSLTTAVTEAQIAMMSLAALGYTMQSQPASVKAGADSAASDDHRLAVLQLVATRQFIINDWDAIADGHADPLKHALSSLTLATTLLSNPGVDGASPDVAEEVSLVEQTLTKLSVKLHGQAPSLLAAARPLAVELDVLLASLGRPTSWAAQFEVVGSNGTKVTYIPGREHFTRTIRIHKNIWGNLFDGGYIQLDMRADVSAAGAISFADAKVTQYLESSLQSVISVSCTPRYESFDDNGLRSAEIEFAVTLESFAVSHTGTDSSGSTLGLKAAPLEAGASQGHSDATTRQGRMKATCIRKYRATPRAEPFKYVALDLITSRPKEMESFVALDTIDGGHDFEQVEVEAADGVDIGSSDD